MLHPSLHDPGALSALETAWRAEPNLRIEPFLRESVAESLVRELRAQAFTLIASVTPHISFQYWSLGFVPDAACDHPLCAFGRWLWDAGARFASAVTGQELGPPADRMVQSTLYTKGSYLDAHNDYDGQRQVAFVLGLSPESVPADAGGHLEFLDVDPERGVTVRERRAPGFNTLDLFDVRAPTRLHRLPLVTRALERRAITGWLYQRDAAS